MKNQTRQPEVWLIAYRMSEKWVTRARGLILVSELQKTKGFILRHSIHRDRDSLGADGIALGGREHRWPCLIRFSLGCIQPERGGRMNVLCKQSGHSSVLPITPDVIKLHTPWP